MTHQFRPLLSAKVFSGTREQIEKNIELLRAHLRETALCSVKWDGWRMFEYNMEARCRSMKPPKNKYTQRVLGDFYRRAAELGHRGVDGEVLVGDVLDKNVMQNTSSGLNSYDGEPDITYMVFDSYQHTTAPFSERLSRVQDLCHRLGNEFPFVKFTEHRVVRDYDETQTFLDEVMAAGGEGIMGRSPRGHYKLGRSSMREGILWAMKPYVDDEAEILRFEEMLENQNEAVINELGHTSRSGHKENLVPKGMMGKAICRSVKFEKEFSVGAGLGLTEALRREIWANPEAFTTAGSGVMLTYCYQEIGVKDRPRQPKWKSLRWPEDRG